MPIPVICGGCKSRFTVSDQFAGRTGPCPKCKAPIEIPRITVKEVTVHEPEVPAATSTGTGRIPTAPIVRFDKPVSTLVVSAIAAGGLVSIVAALLVRLACGPGGAPPWLLATAAIIAAWPCVRIGYAIVRDRELEPYRGRSLLARTLICAAVYASLWGMRGFLPAELTSEMWQWLFIAPIFFFAGALAALATLDFDWGPGVAHFSLYLLFTALLRWAAGFSPV